LNVSVESVAYEYPVDDRGGSLPVLDGINIGVESGEFVSIIGPSGCGKTTLLKLIDGLLVPRSGHITVGGKPVTAPGRDRAMVFQHSSLLPWRTVWGNVAYGLELARVKDDSLRPRVRETVELVGLTDFQSYFPHALSGGMQQRVNIARAVALDPTVLLMDEPFGSLDAQTREELQVELLTIFRRTGKTILFVTHDISEAVFMSDRVVVLSGRPATVRSTLSIDLPRPREQSVRKDGKFIEYYSELWGLLHEREARRR
jgi:ABC-type nitrate/sulfonate/bicarbonate transport system ATPase subunit